MFAQKQKLRCSTACCFPRSLAAAGRAACIDLLSNAAVWSNSIFQKVQYCPARNITSASELYSSMIKGLFHPIHGPVVPPPWGDLTFSVLQYLAIHPQNWHSLSKRELLEQRRKWVLVRGVKFERSYTWWWCWWCLASATPTPDLRFPHIWKLHVTKFELQAAKTIWRKLEPTQVSILLLRSK